MLSGQVCPSKTETEIVLEFLLTSNVLGEAIETISIPIIPDKIIQASTFEGVIINDEEASDQQSDDSDIQSLSLAKIKMSQTGKLEIKFNKKILIPAIKISDSDQADNDTDSQKRQLQGNTASDYHDINEVLFIRVKEDDPEDELDKSVSYLTLNALEEQSISLTVTFNNPDAISTNISEPD